jgi:hypothetical protein
MAGAHAALRGRAGGRGRICAGTGWRPPYRPHVRPPLPLRPIEGRLAAAFVEALLARRVRADADGDGVGTGAVAVASGALPYRRAPRSRVARNCASSPAGPRSPPASDRRAALGDSVTPAGRADQWRLRTATPRPLTSTATGERTSNPTRTPPAAPALHVRHFSTATSGSGAMPRTPAPARRQQRTPSMCAASVPRPAGAERCHAPQHPRHRQQRRRHISTATSDLAPQLVANSTPSFRTAAGGCFPTR